MTFLSRSQKKKGESRDASVRIAAVQCCSHLILSRPEHGVDFFFFFLKRSKEKSAQSGKRRSRVLPYLNYDIRSCQVAVLLGSDNPEDEK